MDAKKQQGRRPFRRPRRNGDKPDGDNTAQGPNQAPAQPQAPPKAAVVNSGVSSAVPSGIATPMLSEAVPSDTPRFADLHANGQIVDSVIIETITDDLKFEHMMPVQAATIHELLPPKRLDALVQAKTGTGKTIAFLLPAIQTMLNKKKRSGGRQGNFISLLVMAPTRELAMQIAKEATNLLKRLPEFRVCIAVGGTNKDREEKQILAGCDILVSTPGRMLDHVSGNDNIKEALTRLDTLVLDEADRLLDMGFLPALKSILACLPDKKSTNRQGMLFSATVPSHVAQVASLVLSPGYTSISTIPKGESNTHAKVPQLLVQVPAFADLMPALVGAIRQDIAHLQAKYNAAGAFKAIVFAQTAAQAEFYGYVIANLPGMPPSWTLHARHAQSKRTNVTNAFRSAPTGMLIATDVVARGMDFPAVTTVIQVGLPMDKETYIHRLGRTARGAANADAPGSTSGATVVAGRGIIIVTNEESFFPTRVLREINFIKLDTDLSSWEAEVIPIIERMDEAMVGKTYQAWLGYYNSHMKSLRWDKAQLVAAANEFAQAGLLAPETPSLQKTTVGKMGLRGTPGLVVVADAPRVGRGRGGGGGGGGGNRGGANNDGGRSGGGGGGGGGRGGGRGGRGRGGGGGGRN
ncbi:atp-dependent rna helicase [Ophiostoma piceae UAMH 11346]|uniref:ATP-dependent RNA helicase n=1 Tax=Ophiostoma piceae (strain UAMH 11346) TaxID=1262450 RepID=S3CCF0_OPHP1|nr:atp-dependent rna helicase [Ophiostoma piceae UAMH 11346]